MRLVTSKAFALAKQYHEGQVDKGGQPYYRHVVDVAWSVEEKFNSLHDEELDVVICVAYLHDILEDTDCPDELILEQFGQRVLDGVKAMTKIKGESYDDYLNRLCENQDAIKVKYCDLIHNMDLTRLNTELSDKDLQRIKKYHNAYLRLKQLI